MNKRLIGLIGIVGGIVGISYIATNVASKGRRAELKPIKIPSPVTIPSRKEKPVPSKPIKKPEKPVKRKPSKAKPVKRIYEFKVYNFMCNIKKISDSVAEADILLGIAQQPLAMPVQVEWETDVDMYGWVKVGSYKYTVPPSGHPNEYQKRIKIRGSINIPSMGILNPADFIHHKIIVYTPLKPEDKKVFNITLPPPPPKIVGLRLINLGCQSSNRKDWYCHLVATFYIANFVPYDGVNKPSDLTVTYVLEGYYNNKLVSKSGIIYPIPKWNGSKCTIDLGLIKKRPDINKLCITVTVTYPQPIIRYGKVYPNSFSATKCVSF